MEIGLQQFVRYHETLDLMGTRDPHELMRCMEVHFIRDCAEMAARASLYRRESRWGYTTIAWTIQTRTTMNGFAMST